MLYIMSSVEHPTISSLFAPSRRTDLPAGRTAWAGNGIQAALEPTRAAQCSDGPKVSQDRVKSRTSITSLNRGGPMIQSHEPAMFGSHVLG
jgi:hypothetical protein